MPVYDYRCKQHGIFHELASMDKAALPCACPVCKQLSPRIIMMPPQVAQMAAEKHKAMAANEKAQHSPIISTLDSRAEVADRKLHLEKSHKHSGNCCGGHRHSEDNSSSLKQQVLYLADGSKIFPSQRPWMISH